MMMRKAAISVFLAAASVALAAQAPVPAKAPATYDSAAEVSYGGVISQVVASTTPDGTVGVDLQLVIAKGTNVTVHLGPAMFIGSNDFYFLADDQVLVTGAFVSHGGQVSLWARQITKKNKTLALRTASGAPLWKLASTTDDPDGWGIPR
jgi:hypothetical protein